MAANAAQESINLAVKEIKDLPGYSDNGRSVFTDIIVTIMHVYYWCSFNYSE